MSIGALAGNRAGVIGSSAEPTVEPRQQGLARLTIPDGSHTFPQFLNYSLISAAVSEACVSTPT
jgi:hypothetical protein